MSSVPDGYGFNPDQMNRLIDVIVENGITESSLRDDRTSQAHKAAIYNAFRSLGLDLQKDTVKGFWERSRTVALVKNLESQIKNRYPIYSKTMVNTQKKTSQNDELLREFAVNLDRLKISSTYDQSKHTPFKNLILNKFNSSDEGIVENLLQLSGYSEHIEEIKAKMTSLAPASSLVKVDVGAVRKKLRSNRGVLRDEEPTSSSSDEDRKNIRIRNALRMLIRTIPLTENNAATFSACLDYLLLEKLNSLGNKLAEDITRKCDSIDVAVNGVVVQRDTSADSTPEASGHETSNLTLNKISNAMGESPIEIPAGDSNSPTFKNSIIEQLNSRPKLHAVLKLLDQEATSDELNAAQLLALESDFSLATASRGGDTDNTALGRYSVSIVDQGRKCIITHTADAQLVDPTSTGTANLPRCISSTTYELDLSGQTPRLLRHDITARIERPPTQK